jgi:S-DNA-T family DNA segregation ATPase FtsK/SpoIIIE
VSPNATRINGHTVSFEKTTDTDGRTVYAMPDAPTVETPDTPPAMTLPKAPKSTTERKQWRRTRNAVRRARAAATHERTRDAGRLTIRHSLYMIGGVRVVWKRGWDGRTTARYDRFMRAAVAVGNYDEAKEWEDRTSRFREHRHRRRMEVVKAPQQLAKGAAFTAGTAVGFLLLLGIAMAGAEHDITEIGAPIIAMIDAVNWCIRLGAALWAPATIVVPLLAALAVWDVGRRHHTAPHWALPMGLRSGDGAPITPSIVVAALRNLGIGPLRKAIADMDDQGAGMLSPIAQAGCGVEVDVQLPMGVSTEEIQNRRLKLAGNLNRHEHEVYITIPKQTRTVRLWIADSGALDEPVPASPLVLDANPTADYKTGRAPWGITLRGDAALVTLYQKMVLVTGLSNQGKTSALRALALWLMFDATVEFRIGDLKGIGDWHMFQGLATLLIEGPTGEHVIDVTDMVEEGVEEMNRRLQMPKGTVFTPLVLIVDEAQVAYGSDEVGADKRPYGGKKRTSRYFQGVKAIHNQGRAVNITIWEGTQDPTDENLPKRSREGNHIRASLVVGTKSQAEMALGEIPVAKGASPHKLRPGVDKGQLVAAGEGLRMAADQMSENVRTHFIDDDEATALVERAKALRSATGTTVDADADPVDHLADLEQVLAGEKRVRTPEVLHRLKNLNPAIYTGWDFARLRRLMTDHGEDTSTYQGYPVVALARVLAAIDEREEDAPEAG